VEKDYKVLKVQSRIAEYSADLKEMLVEEEVVDSNNCVDLSPSERPAHVRINAPPGGKTSISIFGSDSSYGSTEPPKRVGL